MYDQAKRLASDPVIARNERPALVISQRTGMSETTVRKILSGAKRRPPETTDHNKPATIRRPPPRRKPTALPNSSE